jgi:LacI family transcriptional regulator
MLGGDAFSRELMCAVEAALCERGLGIRVIPAVPEGDLPFEIQDGRVDGVIGRFFGPVYGQIAKRVPAVNIDAHDEAADAYSLVPDYALGVYEATARLLRTGHKRIALLTEAPVSGDRGFWSVLAHGCLCALAEAGVSEPPIYCGRASLPAQGYAVGQRVFQGADPRPHAILGPDSALLGVYRAAAECGVRIPDDVSLIGVNNLPYGEFLHPPLTTIDVKVADMAREGTNILSECIKTGRKRKGLELTPVELVVRASARM